MNKKFLSAILFGALMVTSTGTFVSCKDYDDDIDAINKELTDVKSQIAALQAKVDAGKWITSVSSNAAGVTINLSDGSSVNITNGKDGQNGAQGEAGKDGKDGSVVEVKEGVLYIDGVATEIKVAEEAPAALPCVKVENGELMILGENNEYVASGIKACSVVAVKENGVWTITTADGESIVVPGSAALTSIAIQGDKDLTYNYGIVKKATPWGWKQADGTYDEEMEAGFYTRLSKDVNVLLNPAEADGTAFTYTFKNSKGEAADVTFFEEARNGEGVVLTRAASANGLWTLPAAVSKFEAAKSEELRNEMYLLFKQNDGKPYAMTLEAADLLGNTAVRSDYDYTITMAKAGTAVSVQNMFCKVGQEYYPAVEGAVYGYKIRVKQTSSNLRLAKAFGIEIVGEGKGFIANNDAAVYNAIQFELAYVTIGGSTGTKTFSVSFTDEFAVSENMRAEALNTPFDAVKANRSDYVSKAKYAPAEIAPRLNNYNADDDYATAKVFVYKHVYDLASDYAELSADAQLMLTEYVGNATAELIGGEGNGYENYNELNRNAQLLKNIKWTYDTEKNKIEVRFYVTENWTEPTDYDAEKTGLSWTQYSNFQLYTAYQLNLSVADGLSGVEVAKIELPFEFSEPTKEIEQVDGEFTKWGNVHVGYDAYGSKIYERALYVYGIYDLDGNRMRLPLYDSFTAWKAKNSEYGVTRNYQAYVDNAEYYDLSINAIPASVRVFGLSAPAFVTLDNQLDYNPSFSKLSTFAMTSKIQEMSAEVDVDGVQQLELRLPVEARYMHYGVYLAANTTEYALNANGSYSNKVVPYNGKIDNDDFHLVFASWLKHSTLEMEAEEYQTTRGTHVALITNDDLNFTTPKGDAFYLFDGLDAYGKTVKRAELNGSFNESEQHPFTNLNDLTSENIAGIITAKEADGVNPDDITVVFGGSKTSGWAEKDKDGNVSMKYEAFEAADNAITVFMVPSLAETNERNAFLGGMVIVLPKNYTDQESAVVTINLTDEYGYTNSVDITVTKLGK